MDQRYGSEVRILFVFFKTAQTLIEVSHKHEVSHTNVI